MDIIVGIILIIIGIVSLLYKEQPWTSAGSPSKIVWNDNYDKPFYKQAGWWGSWIWVFLGIYMIAEYFL